MEDIYKYLQDPSWWFSAFFIAVIASTIAGFAKDYLARRFDIFLSWSHKHREKLKVDRKMIVDTWSANESLLVIALLQMLYWVLMFVTIMLAIFIYILYLRLRYQLTNLSGFATLPTMTILFLAFAIAGCSFYAFRVIGIISRSADALRGYPETFFVLLQRDHAASLR